MSRNLRSAKNLTSSRARWRPGCPMARHDALPPALRRWLIHAALPWSAASVLRLWQDSLRLGGGAAAALARLQECIRIGAAAPPPAPLLIARLPEQPVYMP